MNEFFVNLRRIGIALFAWSLLGSTASATPVMSSTLLVLGDSLSAGHGLTLDRGWVELLRQRLAAEAFPVEVINASISGETTDGGLRRLPDLLDRHTPSLVIIELGANDGLRGFALDSIRANLTRMVQLVQQRGARPLLVGIRIPPNYGSRYSEPFFIQYQEIAKENSIPLVPFLLEGVAAQPGMMQADGLHPTAAAQPRLLDTVWLQLRPLLPKRSGTALPSSAATQR